MTTSTPEASVPFAADNRDEFSPGTKDLLSETCRLYVCISGLPPPNSRSF
jgi:hypothetical protein